MKNMKAMKIALLLAGAAAGSSAAAQQMQTVPPGRAYTFSSTAPATGTPPFTYQWYRNDVPIDGATELSYTVPGELAYGKGVEFKRGATSSTCPADPIFANSFIVSFCAVLIDGTCWASANVNNVNQFATQPDMYTRFYQWNRLEAWDATSQTVGGWSNSISDPMASWVVNPCPTGWRLPTQVECTALNNLGSTWVNAGTRGAAIAGRFFGPNHASCTLPNNMNSCAFLPACGRRNGSGTLEFQGVNGMYWAASFYTSGNGYHVNLSTSGVTTNSGNNMYLGHSLRCVQ